MHLHCSPVHCSLVDCSVHTALRRSRFCRYRLRCCCLRCGLDYRRRRRNRRRRNRARRRRRRQGV